MAQGGHNHRGRAAPALALAVASWVVLQRNGQPIVDGVEINAVPALAACFLALSGSAVIAETFRFIGSALEVAHAHIPKGHHGSAGWIKHRWQIWREHKWFGWHPYWGMLNGKPLFFDYESVALTIGPPGSNKSTGVVGPMALCIRESKLIPDFKGSLYSTLANTLRRRGEIVRLIDLGNVLGNEDGGADKYNPTCILADCFFRSGGLQDVSDDASEITFQLLQEKENANQDNSYFRIGSRDLIEFCLQINTIILGYDATLAHSLEMLSDRKSLLKHALWASGRLEVGESNSNKFYAQIPIEDSPWIEHHSIEDILDYKIYLRNIGNAIADFLLHPDRNSVGTFLTGAQQSLKRFNITTRTNKVMSHTTFRFSQMKEEVTSVFITADASRTKAQKDALALLQFCALTELKRSPNKHVPVTYLADEATNYQIADLSSFLSWARGFRIKIHIVIQFISEFKKVYGEEALKTLLNAAEIIQFLPGQSEPEVLRLIEDMLGRESVVTKNHNSSGIGEGITSSSYSETGKPLLSMDEIRRCKKTILFVRQLKAMLVELPRIFAISPFRLQIDPDPFHGGKRFLMRVKLRLEGRDGPLLWRLIFKKPKGE